MSTRRPLGFASIRPARFLAAAALATCFTACLLGGTGTDTENGIATDKTDPNALKGIAARVTDSLGKPLAGVALNLFDPAYRPDLGAVPEAMTTNQPGSLVSDTGGYVRLSLKAAGKFVVEGTWQGKTLFFDTLAVADLKQSAIYTFRARAASAFKGKVTLASGMRIDSGRVFIRGTGRTCPVDAAGGYDLGLLPADAARMGLGVRLVSSPVSVLKTIPVKGSMTDSLGTAGYVCRTLSADSAAKVVDSAASPAQMNSALKLDTAKVDSALKACGTLERGSVINYSGGQLPVVVGTTAPNVNLLVLSGSDSTPFTSPKSLDPVVVPLAECVPTAGKEATSYEVDVHAGAAANDLVVQDVEEKCLGP
jgi:hypothetical protein